MLPHRRLVAWCTLSGLSIPSAMAILQDEGLKWTAPAATLLPNNNAGIEAFQLASGSTLLLFNNESGKDSQECTNYNLSPATRMLFAGTGVRTPMTAALSLDGGDTWPHSRNLQVRDFALH